MNLRQRSKIAQNVLSQWFVVDITDQSEYLYSNSEKMTHYFEDDWAMYLQISY